jgi:CheY-like chemotaxis protein
MADGGGEELRGKKIAGTDLLTGGPFAGRVRVSVAIPPAPAKSLAHCSPGILSPTGSNHLDDMGRSGPTRRGVRTRMTANGKTVLLVEDNEDNRIVYSTILRHFGYSVTEALNGEEGIAKARSEKPDLILMDISIPVIDGWEATQVLKHDPQTRQIPIIALTAHALASDREKAMEVGCDGYLAKPCEPRAVVAEVQRFLGKSDGSAA